MDELRREQASEARLLYEKYGDRWPLDPLDGIRPPLGKARCRKLWRKAILYARTIVAMKARPPKQQTRQELDKLLQIAIRATRKKIYYSWDCILGICGIDPTNEKRRQRRLKMKSLSNANLLKEPKGNDVRGTGLAGILRNKEIGPGCTEVEVLKLFAHQVGPSLNEEGSSPGEDGWIMDEPVAKGILDYCSADVEERVPLPKKDDPFISYKVFFETVYPNEEERAEWDEERAEKIRLEREEKQKDERQRKLYEQKMEAARAKAIMDVNDAWDQSYHEVFMNMIGHIVGLREQDPNYKKAKFKVGWGVKIGESHKKSLYHIFTAGLDPPEFQTTARRRINEQYFAKNHGRCVHVPLNPIRLCMVNCIMNSRGLDGLKIKEAVECILEYLTLRMQAAYRGLKKRRVIRRAMKMWKDKEAAFKSVYFGSWAKWALTRTALRKFCWRPLREWNRWFKGVKRIQRTYVGCFWPFYVWRRWAVHKILARKKGKQLKRIWLSYEELRHFKAWGRYVKKEVKDRRIATDMRLRLMHKLVRLILKKWRRYAQRRKGCRLAWFRRGYRMAENKKMELKYRVLHVWRYFNFCRKLIKGRVEKYFRGYILDEQDRRIHAIKKAKEAKSVASKPRNKVEHTSKGIDSLTGGGKDGKEGKGNGGKKKRRSTSKKGGTKKATSTASDKQQTPKKSPRQMIHRMDTSPAFLAEGVAKHELLAFKAQLEGGKQKVDTGETYIAPVGDPFYGCRYTTKPPGLEPRTPPFPTVFDTPWASSLPDDMIKICEGCYERFKTKCEFRMKTSYAMLHRTGPRCLQFLYNNVVLNKKDRFVVHLYKRKMKRHYFKYFVDQCRRRITGSVASSVDSDGLKRDSLISTFDIAPSIASSRDRFKTDMDGVALTRDQLEYDREIRNTQMDKTYGQTQKLRDYVKDKKEQLVEWQRKMENKQTLRERRETLMKQFMEQKASETHLADKKSLDYVAEFQVHAARRLFEVAARIREEVDRFYGVNIKWRYIRRIRLLVMMRRASSMFARQKLRNWLRLCVKWRKVEKGMVTYKRVKDLWVCFNGWLKFMERQYMFRTPGMGKEATKAKKRVVVMSNFLRDHKLLPRAIPYQTMNKIYGQGVKATFMRWFYFTMMNKNMRKIEDLMVERHELRFKRRVFHFWKTGVKTEDSYQRRKEDIPFSEGRCSTDLECMRARFINAYRGDLNILIRRENLKRARIVAEEARNGPSFKKFIHGLRNSVRGRVMLEQRMLIEAFAERGRLDFEDVKGDDVAGKGGRKEGSTVISGSRAGGSRAGGSRAGGSRVGESRAGGSRAGGSRASSPTKSQANEDASKASQTRATEESNQPLAAGLKSFSDAPIPAGYGIGEITVVMKQGGGIVGLMSTAKAESKEREMGKFGPCSVGMSEVFSLKTEEQLVTMDVVYGAVIERVRFHTSSGRKSKWFGQKISPTPHHKRLSAENEEAEDILYPMAKYIVGFHGFVSRLRIVGLGIITRVVRKQYVFSYYWIRDGGNVDASALEGGGGEEKKEVAWGEDASVVEDPVERERLEARRLDDKRSNLEFAYILRMRRSNLESALTRAEAFARHLWTSRAIQMNWRLTVFAKFRVISMLSSWFFEAVAFRLVHLPETDGEAERMILAGEKCKEEGVRLVEKAGFMKKSVEKDEIRARPWKTEGIISRKDRESEKEYQKNIQEGYAEVEEMRQEGLRMQVEGEDMVGDGKAKMPAIENSPGVMAYFAKLISVARREIQMEEDFGGDYFASVIKGSSTKKNKGFPVDDGWFNGMLGSVKVAQDRLREQERMVATMMEEMGMEGSSYLGMGNTLSDITGGMLGESGFGTTRASFQGLAKRAAGMEVSGQRAMLALPRGEIVEERERTRAQWMKDVEKEDRERDERVGTTDVVKLPDINMGRLKLGISQRMQTEARKVRAAVRHEIRRREDWGESRAGSRAGSQGGRVIEDVEGLVPFKRLKTPEIVNRGGEGREEEGEEDSEEEFEEEDWMAEYDEYDDDDFISPVPSFHERQKMASWKLADPNLDPKERTHLLNKRIMGMGHEDGIDKWTTTEKEDYYRDGF
ncbi:hypothetical protein TrRE_jg84 [Triparma retinervis]|uniref:Uncharacterized protein n=1 Tax=Triparma retinervis TaxID=2557542 RepID=A0A9W6ZG69_9STRA|nr:hypothetical protein TrRE_jg84 [Triparma retinervis]